MGGMRIPKDVGERVTLCSDGKYRWRYDVHLLKNPSILFDVWKVLGISIGVVIVFVMLLGGCGDGFDVDSLKGAGGAMLITAAILGMVSILGYLFYAAMVGWKYEVLFTMDEKEVVHQQSPASARKAERVGKLAAMAGAAAGRPGVVGTGMLAASYTTMITELADVKRLIPCRKMHLIKVNELLEKNRVYVADEDFDFVYDFLCQHCPKASR